MKKKYHLVLTTFLFVVYIFPIVNAKEFNKELINIAKNAQTSSNPECSPYPQCVRETTIIRPEQWLSNIFISVQKHEKKNEDTDNSNTRN